MFLIGTRRALLGGGIRPIYFENFLAELALSSNLSFSRASGAWAFNAAGNLASAASNVARFDHDASGNPIGLLIEPGATNYIPNSSAAGASPIGTGSNSLPTGWTHRNVGASYDIAAVGTENGLPYVDLHYHGTTSGGLDAVQFGTSFAAANGQVWESSTYLRLVAGSLANVSSIQLYAEEDPYAGGGSAHFSANITPTSAALVTQRAASKFTFNQSGTTSTFMALWMTFPTAAAIDFTLRIGVPTMELSAFPTSPILTSSGALARAADVVSFVNPPAGPIIVEWTDEATGVTSRTLYAGGAFSWLTGKRYRQIAAYKPGTPPVYLNTRLTVGGPL